MISPPSTRPSLLFRMRDPQDHAAWIEFVALYEPAIYRLFRQHGLQDADARELTQDLFLALSRSIDRWDPAKERGSFRGWLRRVCRNLVINWSKRRKQAVVAMGGDQWQSLLDMAPAADSPESLEFDREVRRAMFHRASTQVRLEVTAATWQAFFETCVQGIAAATAAEKLGMTPGAVRVAKCRVLARLQVLVRAWEKEQAI